MSEPVSTTKWPPAKWVTRFHVGMIDDDTIGDYLEKGYSLGIGCRNCRRLIEWTPAELEKRFGERPGFRIADIAPRLSCKGEGGCGSDDIAVFIHLYDGQWTWARPPAPMGPRGEELAPAWPRAGR